MVNGLYYSDDKKAISSKIKIGQMVEYYDIFDGKNWGRKYVAPLKAMVVGIYPDYILLEVFGKIGNFRISCNLSDLMSSESRVYIKPLKGKIRK